MDGQSNTKPHHTEREIEVLEIVLISSLVTMTITVFVIFICKLIKMIIGRRASKVTFS